MRVENLQLKDRVSDLNIQIAQLENRQLVPFPDSRSNTRNLNHLGGNEPANQTRTRSFERM